MGEDLVHLDRIHNDGDDVHLGAAVSADKRIDLVDFGDEAGPCGRGGPAFDLLRRHRRTTRRAAIIAALDNLLWDRDMIREVLDFDYVWEVYKPAAGRRYGYYVLPVLWAGRSVARFEPGVNQRAGSLLIRN